MSDDPNIKPEPQTEALALLENADVPWTIVLSRSIYKQIEFMKNLDQVDEVQIELLKLAAERLQHFPIYPEDAAIVEIVKTGGQIKILRQPNDLIITFGILNWAVGQTHNRLFSPQNQIKPKVIPSGKPN
jgi:hypothetical protein